VHRKAFQQKYLTSSIFKRVPGALQSLPAKIFGFQSFQSSSSVFNGVPGALRRLPAFSNEFRMHREAFQQKYLTSSIFIPLEFTFKLIPFPLFAF
jgi:hypothetical protein